MDKQNNKLLFIGEFPPPYGGVTIKDALLRDEVFDEIGASIFDLYEFKRKPARALLLCCSLIGEISKADNLAIGVGSNSRLDKLLGVILRIKGKKFLSNVTVFMMGRRLPEYIRSHPKQAWKFQSVRCIYVESKSLVTDFADLKCDNAQYLPNFRNGEGACPPRPEGDVVRFVFFAQVRPEKGIDTLLEASKRLISEGLADKFDVAIYGSIIEGYEDEFGRLIDQVPNAEYKGVFDAAIDDVYAELNQYDVAVSSSSWMEGMSGSNIECKFAGIANIVSSAGFNSECVHNGIDGLLVEPGDVDSLLRAMRYVIGNRGLLSCLKSKSYEGRVEYDVFKWKDGILNGIVD